MEPKGEIYECEPIIYYSYWNYSTNSLVITDNHDEYTYHLKRIEMGKNKGIHLEFLKKHPQNKIG
jgi:hypothetical protein